MPIRIVLIAMAILLSLSSIPATAAAPDSLVDRVVAAAAAKLPGLTAAAAEDVACLTSAGYVSHDGRGTRHLYDDLGARLPLSIGRGNLLPVHVALDRPLYFAFVLRRPAGALDMVRITAAPDGSLSVAGPQDVRVGIGTDFGPFEKHFGAQAFALVTLANGWADRVPEDILAAALFHDHLCCGVFTGRFTVDFLRDRLPLSDGQHYVWIGAPAWCQDDYIQRAFNLTPGKHGYLKMAYPWWRPWKTAAQTFDRLGGIAIRWDPKTERGTALVLRFDWRHDDFRRFVDRPALELDWKGQPWLHVAYNRFFLRHLDQPADFVAVIRQVELASRPELDALVDLGANPLARLLGNDPTWH